MKSQLIGQLSQLNLEKTVILETIEGGRRTGQKRMRWLDDITNSMDMNLSNLQEMVKERKTWHTAVNGVTKSQTRLSGSTTAKLRIIDI